ncbi:LysR substrate-binding domain-containing protein [Xylophilus sp. GW821-FHT01B05]
MRLRHIEVFNAIMLTGSVSAAARLINVTQPAVSRTLQHAELQLGFPLFQRTRGRLVPTTEALTLYPHIERLFAQLDEVQRLAENLRTAQDAGELRILTVLALSYEVLPRALHLFRQQHAGIAIRVEALHSPQIMSALLLREADVGFVFSPAAHPSLTQEALAESRIVCIAPKGMLPARLVRRGWVALDDIAELPAVALDARDPVGISLNQACRDAGVGLQAVVTVQTYHAALSMAHHGLGVALVDGCTACSADREKVDVLRLEPHIPVPIRVLRQADKPDSVAVRAIARAMQQALKDVA